jgi:hypothetical protein
MFRSSRKNCVSFFLNRKTQVEEALLLFHRSDLMFCEWKWKCLSGALQLLGPFQVVTAELSSITYPSKAFSASKVLRDKLDAITITNHHDALIMMRSNLKEKHR